LAHDVHEPRSFERIAVTSSSDWAEMPSAGSRRAGDRRSAPGAPARPDDLETVEVDRDEVRVEIDRV
jgi:hypothetical protein